MGAWGPTGFESDDALDLLENFRDRLGEMDKAVLDSMAPLVELVRLGDTTEYEGEFHGAAELLAATLTDNWGDYRIGGGSGVFSDGKDQRAWLPDEAVATVPVLREGLYFAEEGSPDARAVRDAAARWANRLDGAAAATRETNPEGWNEPEPRARALESTAVRLRGSLS